MGSLLGLSWTLVTYLIVPVLIFEEGGVYDSIERSASLFRKRWGEQIAGSFGFGLLSFLMFLPGLALAFLPVKPALWTMLIPTFGQQILINQVMRGQAVAALSVGVSMVVTLALAVVLVGVAVRLYERERILFGKT